jgi:DNA-binding MarR family transcriptional regulator
MKRDPPCACSALRRATRAVRAAYAEALKPTGLRITQFAVLRTLARLGPVPVTRLATETALDWSTMGRNLNSLERDGFVRLAVGEADQRERVAHLTEAGREAIEAALPYWREAQKSIESLVEFSEIAGLADQLSRLREK